MEEEKKEIQTPDFSGEEMKLPENSTDSIETTETKSTVSGAVLIVLALLLVTILAGLYYWFTTINNVTSTQPQPITVERPTIEENNEPESTEAEAEVETLGAVSTSDEIEAIEADIESTNLDELDAELNAIDAELDAALSDI